MKTILYHFILIVLVVVSMVTTALIIGELIGYDSVGVKGAVAGAGLAVIYGRKGVFGFLDKMFKVGKGNE